MRGKRPALSQRGQQVALLLAKAYGPQEVARELGISPGTAGQHITRVLDFMQMRSRVPGAAKATPSVRGAQVAEMVREGMSDRQIAEQLGLGQRTVESHVARLLRKSGVSSRYEIASPARPTPPRVRRPVELPTVQPAARPLTKRQQEIWALVAEGCTNTEIADRLGIGPRTVETVVRVLRKKLGARNRIALATAYVRSESAGKLPVSDPE
jgi:DNA-binding NarL/FixJ family response regulator